MVAQADLPRTACVAEHRPQDPTRHILLRTRAAADPEYPFRSWQDQLDGFLDGNRGKAAREQLTLIRIYEELCSLGRRL